MSITGFLRAPIDEAPNQHPHRLDRLNPDKRKVAQDERRIAQGREAIRFSFMLCDALGHPPAEQTVAESVAINSDARGNLSQHVGVCDIAPKLEGGPKNCGMVRRERIRRARKLGSL